MTENTHEMPAGEEPTSADNQELQPPTGNELPAATDEATQITTMPATPPAADEPTQFTPVEATSSVPEAAPVEVPSTPAPAYDQFSAPTEAVQQASDATTPVFAQPQASNPAYYAQYAAQPGQPLPAYPNYAQYPGQPVPVAPVAKKRRVWLWVALIALVIVLVGGGTTFAFAFSANHPNNQAVQAKVQGPTPNETLAMYCQDVTSGNAQGIYDLLSQQARVHTSLDDLQQQFDAISQASSLGMNMQFTNCTFDNLRVSGALAVATVSITTSLSMQVQGQSQSQSMTSTTPDLVSLVLEHGQWKIDFSQFAQPRPKVTLPNFVPPTTTPTN